MKLSLEFFGGPMDGVLRDDDKWSYDDNDVGRVMRQRIRLPDKRMAEKLQWEWCGDLLDAASHCFHLYRVQYPVENGAIVRNRLIAVYEGWDRLNPNRGLF